jgi:cyclopropane fatty-acyl-phospholipid synthase-like methyltransferase
MALTYNPDAFNVRDIPEAMRIILTAEETTTEQRWRLETPHVRDLISGSIDIKPNSFVLDYGCGIGRIAKELIARHGCHVVGVDISPSMRVLSLVYVASDQFTSVTPGMLGAMSERGFRFDTAISVWVLQHCPSPAHDISRLRAALAPNGRLWVLNADKRCVPTKESGWVDDNVDVKDLLKKEFDVVQEGHLAPGTTTDYIMRTTYWASLAPRPAAETT